MINALLLNLLLALTPPTAGLVTLQTVREVTNCTRDYAAEIMALGMVLSVNSIDIGQTPVLELRNEDEDEIEDIVTAALAAVDGKILQALNIPLNTDVEWPGRKESCQTIVAEYHMFLAATTHFLNAVQERQMANHWDGKSLVFHNLAYMQALWASPKKNKQRKSFIEQQMMLYEPTSCFGKTKEVLQRSVEIVEYMNDLIDTFGS